MEKAFLSFETSDEIPEDLDDQVVAAKHIMNELKDALGSAAFDFVSDVKEWNSYGCYFDVRIGKVEIITMLQASDQWLILNWAHRSFADRLLKRKHDQEVLAVRAAVIAAAISIFPHQKMRWLSQAEFVENAR